MGTEQRTLINTVEGLANKLELPKAAVKRLVDQKAIPYLDLGSRKMFCLEAVQAKLAELACAGHDASGSDDDEEVQPPAPESVVSTLPLDELTQQYAGDLGEATATTVGL